MDKFALMPNVLRDAGLSETKRVAALLTQRGKTVLMEEQFREEAVPGAAFLPQEALLTEAEAAIVLGGDGTMLSIAPQAARHGVPLLGINLGNLGFLAQAEQGDYRVFDALFQGDYTVFSCMMLDIAILREGRELRRFIALNDVVAVGDDHSRMIRVSAAVNGTCIGAYSADGLIVATAVGSTAYSLSAGGAVMYPEMDAMMLTPICPHTLKARTTVVPGEDVVELNACPTHPASVIILVDGKRSHVLMPDETVRVTRSAYRTRLINANHRNFFDVLRAKLSD